MLNTNFKKYSGITLIDQQNLNQVLAEQRLSGSGDYSDQDYINSGLYQYRPADQYPVYPGRAAPADPRWAILDTVFHN
jgi:hypothetical protein